MCQPRITRHYYFHRMGYDLHDQKEERDLYHGFSNLFIICIILTKWSLAHFAELSGLNRSAQDAY
jgi:hypothetical protein